MGNTLSGELQRHISTKDIPEISQEVKEALVSDNLKSLSNDKKAKYLEALCTSVGLNPLSQPFMFLETKANQDAPTKHKVYATRDATEQLRKLYGVSAKKTDTKQSDEVYIVDVEVSDNSGRTDFATGAVALKGKYGAFKGETLANAIMRCETKAKRRATLSICGLGFLDETEIDTMIAKPLGDNSKPSELPGEPSAESQPEAPAPIRNETDPTVIPSDKRKALLDHIPAGEMPIFSEFLEWLSTNIIRAKDPIREVADIPSMGFYFRILKAVSDNTEGPDMKSTEYELWKEARDKEKSQAQSGVPAQSAREEPEMASQETKQGESKFITHKEYRELLSKLPNGKEDMGMFREFIAYLSKEVWGTDPPVTRGSEIKRKNYPYILEAMVTPDGGMSGFEMWKEQRNA